MFLFLAPVRDIGFVCHDYALFALAAKDGSFPGPDLDLKVRGMNLLDVQVNWVVWPAIGMTSLASSLLRNDRWRGGSGLMNM